MNTKDEMIAIVNKLAHEAKRGWDWRDGLVTAEEIRNEHRRIDEATEKVIKYLRGQN